MTNLAGILISRYIPNSIRVQNSLLLQLLLPIAVFFINIMQVTWHNIAPVPENLWSPITKCYSQQEHPITESQ